MHRSQTVEKGSVTSIMNPTFLFRSKSQLKIFFTVLFGIAISLSLASPAFANQSASSNHKDEKRVLVVSMPRLTWEAFQTANTPNIDSIISKGSIGTLSVRVLGAQSVTAKGYATISAGNRSNAADSASAGFADPDEIYNAENARDVFFNQRGKISVANPAALGLNFEMSLEANRKSLDNSKIGSFAKSLSKDSKSIAVFGNADTCLTDSPYCFDRSIAYVGVNPNGVLKSGDVSRELLVENPDNSSTRLSLDYEKLSKKVNNSIEKNDVTVAECSDLERIDGDRKSFKAEVYAEQLADAIGECDQFIGLVLSSLDLKRDQIFVLSPSSPREKEETTFFAAAGNGIKKGYASSSATRIKGAVTLVDIAPSILEFLGAPVPDPMNGSVFDWKGSNDSVENREEFVISLNERAVARDETLKPTVWFMVFVLALSMVMAMVSFTRNCKWASFAKFLALLSASIPMFTFILQPAMVVLAKPFRLIMVLLLLSSLFAFALQALAKKYGISRTLLLLASSYLLIEIGDILTGGRLQFNSIFGNATLVAGRFAGFNNQSFAILSIAMILFVAMVKQVTSSFDPKAANKVNVFLVVFMVFILLVDGAPQFGSDVGGVLALTPTIFIISMMLWEKKVKIKTLFLSGFATVSALGMFTLADLSRPEEKRTHLGRFANQLFKGDGGIVIERKMVAALRSFTRLDMIMIVLIGALFLLFLAFHKGELLKKASEGNYGFKLLVFPGLFLAVLGTLLNDSGVTIPALMMLVGIPAVALLVFESYPQTAEVHSSTDEKMSVSKSSE